MGAILESLRVIGGRVRSGHFAGKEASQARRAMLGIIAIAHYSADIFFIYQPMHFLSLSTAFLINANRLRHQHIVLIYFYMQAGCCLIYWLRQVK